MASQDYQHIEVAPLSNVVGAELSKVDLNALNDSVLAEIKAAFHDYGVVFFRDQVLSPEQHIVLAQRFGDINVNRFFQPVAGHPQIAEVRKEPSQKSNIGGNWHTDHSYDEEPAIGSLLYALEVPEVGGDTLFASMEAAYTSLSEGLQRLLRTLRAEHSSRHVFGAHRHAGEEGDDYRGRLRNAELATQDMVHPVVIKHPQTGRPCLYVNPGFTLRFEGWTDQESQPLLDYLYAQAVTPEHTCRFRWTPGAVALWDNRNTWHRALNDYPGERRLMHRITLEGTALEAV